MKNGNYWKVGAVALALILGATLSCTRSISVPVSPTFSAATATNTLPPTNTATVTPTSTPSKTPTFTITNTPNGPTATPTNTGTNTATFTITNTPTNTPTPTITYTPTNTPTPTPNPNLIADFEEGSMADVSQSGLSGSWYGVTSTGSSGMTAILNGGTGCSIGHFVSIGGTTGTAAPVYAALQGDFVNPTGPYSINSNAPANTNAFVFCIKSNTLSQVWFNVSSQATTQSSANCGMFVPVTSSWTSVTVCFNHMQVPSWAPASIAGQTFDANSNTAISAQWQVTAPSTTYDIELDNFQFAQVGGATCPSFTPTATINPLMIDDFENNTANIYAGPGGTGPVSWSGSWYTVTDGSVNIFPVTASGSWVDSAPGDASNYAAHVTISGSVTQNASFGFNFQGGTQTSTSTVNLSAYTGIIFDVKADASYPALGNYMTVQVGDSDTESAGGICSTCSDYHSAKVCLSTSWTPVTVFWSQLGQTGWGVPQVAFKPASIYGVSFAFPVSQNAGGMGVWVDNVQLTTAAPPAALGSKYISDFDFNDGGTSINPNLTNYPAAGAKGFQTVATAAGAVIMSPFVLCGSGDASNFAGAVSCAWTDPANSTYPSAQFQVFLMSTPSGGVTTYYNLPTGLTGIQFAWNVLTNTTSGTTPAGISLHYNNANIDGTSQYGTCTGGCWDDYTASLPNTAGGGWSNQSVAFSSMQQGYPSTTTPADACEPGGGASGAAFPYAGGCYNNTTIGFSWSAQSGNNAGNYVTYFEVDNVTFY